MIDAVLNGARRTLQVAIVAGVVAYALDLYRGVFGLVLYVEQILALALGAAMAAVFLAQAVAEGPGRAIRRPLYALFAVLALGAVAFISVNYPTLTMMAALLPTDAVAASAILLLLLFEAVRLSSGRGILIVVCLFMLYGLFGHVFPGDFESRYTSPAELAVYLAIDPNGVLGVAIRVAVVVVVPYVLFGQMLARLGAADFFNDASMVLMGRFRGGPAKVAIVASGLFGTISGTAVGNVVGTGVVTIPMMKRSGVTARDAGAIEAVASTGGQLVPPVMGAAAFIMADFMQVAYTQVVIAALVPGLLYYLALFINVDLLAAKSGIRAVGADAVPRGRDTLRKGWYFLVPFAVLFYALFALHLRPERAAMWAAGTLLVAHYLFAAKGTRLTPRDLLGIVIGAGSAAKELIIVCAAAGLIIGVLNQSGLAFNLTMHIIAAAGGSIVLLAIITACISVVLGMGMPTVGVYILLATLVVPSLVTAGVPVMAAHLFVFYFGLLSMITPPVALATFAAANIAEASAWETSLSAMRLGWTAYVVPFLFIFAPSLLLQGSAIAILFSLATAIFGIWLVTCSIVGYLSERLSTAARLTMAVAGILVLLPHDVGALGLPLNIAGMVVAAIVVARHLPPGRLAR